MKNTFKITIVALVLTLSAKTSFAQPKTFTEAEREQATKEFIKGYTEQNITKGIEFRQQNQLFASITVLTKAVLVDPHNADALVNRAVSYHTAGQFYRAYKDLEIAVNNNPEHYGANLQIGYVLLQLGYADEALQYLRKATAMTKAANTANKLVAFFTMEAEMFTGNYQQAIENFNEFFKLHNPENNNAYPNDAFLKDAVLIATECYLALGNKAEAEKTYRIATDQSAHYFGFYFGSNFGGKIDTEYKPCEGNADKFAERAAKLYQKATDQYRKDPSPDFDKKFHYKYKGWKSNYFEAFVEIQNGLRCDPDNISLLQTRTALAATTIGREYYYRFYYRQLERQMLKNYNLNTREILAGFRYKALLTDDPKYFSLYSFSKEYVKNRLFAGGDEVNLEGLDFNFASAAMAIKAAEQLFNDRDPRKETTTRLSYLNAALELDPNNADALALRARTFANAKSPYLDMLAWRDATAALKINPNIVSAYTVRSLILQFEKKFPEALIEINKGLTIDPNNQKALLNRGLAYIAMGKKEAGFKDLNRTIELSPENGAYYAVRAAAYNTDGQSARAIADYKQASKLNSKYVDRNSDIELIKIYDKIGDKASADAAHKEYYYQYRYWITNKLIPNYETIADRNPALVAEIEADFTQQNINVAAKEKAREAEKVYAAINAYNILVDSYNRTMAYYNSKIEQQNKQTSQAAKNLVRDWNSYNTSTALADMRALIVDLLRDHGAYLPADMKSQVESILKGMK